MQKTDSSSECTRREAAIIAASRLVKDGDAVFVGQGLPVIVALYAKRHHADGICHESRKESVNVVRFHILL